MVFGGQLAGKTTVSAMLSKEFGFSVIDMKAITEKVRAKLSTEDEPFEGEVPVKDIEKEIVAIIAAGRASKTTFVFDGFTHSSAEDFIKFVK